MLEAVPQGRVQVNFLEPKLLRSPSLRVFAVMRHLIIRPCPRSSPLQPNLECHHHRRLSCPHPLPSALIGSSRQAFGERPANQGRAG